MTHLHVFDTIQEAAWYFGDRWPRVSLGFTAEKYILVNTDKCALTGMLLTAVTNHASRPLPDPLAQMISERLEMGSRLIKRGAEDEQKSDARSDGESDGL